MNEGFIKRLFKEVLDVDIALPLRRLTYSDAMKRFGSDKPDVRFGMEICDLSEMAEKCGFSVFADAVKSGGSVRGIAAKAAADKLSRKEIDKLGEFVKGIGAKGLAYIRWVEDKPNVSFGKFMTEDEIAEIKEVFAAFEADLEDLD